MEEVDLFTGDMRDLPEELVKVLMDYEEECSDGFTYEKCKEMLERCEEVGYTFDYGLDAQPFGLKEI